MDEDKTFVVCVEEKDRHTPESVLVKCRKCFKNVWCSPWNLMKIPICWECVNKDPNVKSISTNIRDILRAVFFIKENK